jgi:hypothetical protein
MMTPSKLFREEYSVQNQILAGESSFENLLLSYDGIHNIDVFWRHSRSRLFHVNDTFLLVWLAGKPNNNTRKTQPAGGWNLCLDGDRWLIVAYSYYLLESITLLLLAVCCCYHGSQQEGDGKKPAAINKT